MTFSQFKNNKFIRSISNFYVLILIIFIIWMFFFDENSYFVDKEFNDEIEKLETDKNFYQTQIIADKKKIKELASEEQLDRFAREKYKMKRKNEEIFIIEYDTIK